MARQRKIRIGRLNTLGGILVEMARVYRECRREELDSLEGFRLVAMLKEMRESLKATEIEDRIRALEAKT